MRKLSFLWILGFSATLVGCAHGHTRGTVVFKDSDKEGHICIGHGEAKSGDVVKVYKSVCKSHFINGGERSDRRRTICEKHLLGEGRIIEFSNEHFARIEALGNLKLERGLIVEKAGN